MNNTDDLLTDLISQQMQYHIRHLYGKLYGKDGCISQTLSIHSNISWILPKLRPQGQSIKAGLSEPLDSWSCTPELLDQAFPKEPWFLLLKRGFREQDLGAGCFCCY